MWRRLLEQHRGLDQPETEPALGLGHGDAGPALVDHRRPEPSSILAAGVDDRPDLRRRGRPSRSAPASPQRSWSSDSSKSIVVYRTARLVRHLTWT